MHQSFKAGDVIIRQGSYETSAYIIESGKVEISITVNDKKTVFAIMGEKQIFGESLPPGLTLLTKNKI